MNRLALAAAGLGFASVTLGAFGAHALGDTLGDEALGWWNTATSYTLPHAAAGLTIALAGLDRAPRLAGWFMVTGATIFAVTLYAMALGAPRSLGAVTPIGGVFMLVGWALAVVSAARR